MSETDFVKFHLRDLPRCMCGKPATVELFNHVNSSFGKFCNGCGKRKLNQMNAVRK